jgi:hypothetical protein
MNLSDIWLIIAWGDYKNDEDIEESEVLQP